MKEQEEEWGEKINNVAYLKLMRFLLKYRPKRYALYYFIPSVGASV